MRSTLHRKEQLAHPAHANGSLAPFLYRFEAQLTPTPIGVVHEGLLMANAFDGRVVAGILPGARVWGIDHLLVRRDGVGVIDAPKAIVLGDRRIAEHVRGYCIPPEGMQIPPLEAMIAPGFEWPAVPFRIVATSTFRTTDPELAFLDTAIASIEGEVVFTTGRLEVETRLLCCPRGGARR